MQSDIPSLTRLFTEMALPRSPPTPVWPELITNFYPTGTLPQWRLLAACFWKVLGFAFPISLSSGLRSSLPLLSQRPVTEVSHKARFCSLLGCLFPKRSGLGTFPLEDPGIILCFRAWLSVGVGLAAATIHSSNSCCWRWEVYAMVRMRRQETSFRELILSFQIYAGYRRWTQIASPVKEAFYLLSHLAGGSLGLFFKAHHQLYLSVPSTPASAWLWFYASHFPSSMSVFLILLSGITKSLKVESRKIPAPRISPIHSFIPLCFITCLFPASLLTGHWSALVSKLQTILSHSEKKESVIEIG